MTENATPIVERVTGVLTAAGYASAKDAAAPAGQRTFVVNGAVHADRRSYFNVRDSAG
jgi:hypothetical protein